MPGLNEVHIPVSQFEEQMNWLHANGYTTVSLQAAVQSLQTQLTLPEKSIVLTFDDGYHSLYHHARPLLKKLGFQATLFLTTSCVGGSYTTLAHLEEQSYPLHDRPLTWQELKEMKAEGWAIEAHGHSHHHFPLLSDADILLELSICRKLISDKLGTIPRYFAYPFGDYNKRTVETVKKIYKAACSVHVGKSRLDDDPYRMHRIEINKNDSLESFKRKIETGFSSSTEKTRSMLRDVAYSSLRMKDFLRQLSSLKK